MSYYIELGVLVNKRLTMASEAAAVAGTVFFLPGSEMSRIPKEEGNAAESNSPHLPPLHDRVPFGCPFAPL